MQLYFEKRRTKDEFLQLYNAPTCVSCIVLWLNVNKNLFKARTGIPDNSI